MPSRIVPTLGDGPDLETRMRKLRDEVSRPRRSDPNERAWRDDRGDACCREYAEGAGGMGHPMAIRVHGHSASASHDRGVSMKPIAFLLLACTVPGTEARATSHDRTDAALARCLDDPANASTAGQTECQARAMRTWDERMNAAYATLMKRLPAKAGQRLRLSAVTRDRAVQLEARLRIFTIDA
jgi:uncharacterized protein YecT (DUF1311 family)